MSLRRTALLLIILAIACNVADVHHASSSATQRAINRTQRIPVPADVLGFTPGDDRKLASWNQVLTYFDKLAQTSDRVKFETLGKSTMGRPFVMATISAPENLARLEEYKSIQAQLADPRQLGPNPAQRAAQLIARGKTIVLITCGIHSTEVGSYLSSMLIAHRLASSDEPEIQNILKNTIILLVPSLNPDGVDIVKEWYDKTLGTPYEGTEPPQLYHKYTGHDNNRDWYAFTQEETKITVAKIHNVWHPQIVHDIHQQGAFGSRLFLPPYMQPVEPNVPKQIVAGYTELGNWMAKEMRAQGFEGITTNSTYDAWSPSRAYSHYHGGVRMLSETASCKIATPITIKFEELRSREGYDPQKESANFGPVWRGGEWRLRDITKYMTTAAFLLLKHAADNREIWVRRFYEIGRDAVKPSSAGELFGFTISSTPDAGRLLKILQFAGVQIEALPGTKKGETSDESFYVPLSQPYGRFAKALLESQHYPDLRDGTGHPIAPYDVTAHSLQLLMGVKVEPVFRAPRTIGAIDIRSELIASVSADSAPRAPAKTAIFKSQVPTIDEGWTRWVFENNGRDYAPLTDAAVRSGNLKDRYDAVVIPDQPPRATLAGYRAGSMPPEYTGGLGPEGVKSLREFVEAGGRLVCLNRASDFAIEQFKLPLKNVVGGLPRTDFYVPGSILRIELDTSNPLAEGMPKESIAWAEDSPVFEVTAKKDGSAISPDAVHVIARYQMNSNPLLSGWLLGGDRIKGKAALVEVTFGKGRIILFGFRPQYRGQSLATYPLFFNAISGR